MVGSVTDRVVRSCEAPVLVVPCSWMFYDRPRRAVCTRGTLWKLEVQCNGL